MATLEVSCKNQKLKWDTEPEQLFSGNIKIDGITFSFCPLWEGFVKTAVFYKEGQEPFHILLDENNTCFIPHEVTETNGLIYCGVFGVKGDCRRTTEVISFYLDKGITTEGAPSEPTPDIYQQILSVSNEAYEIACSVRDELENGDFSGIVIDDELSDTSENAIQNKVVTYWVRILEGDISVAVNLSNGASQAAIANREDIAELNEKVTTALHESSEATLMASSNAQKIAELEEDIGDIDTALENIIAIQNSLIGGDAE